MPIALGFFAIGTAKWPKMGPWDIGIPLYRLFAVLSVLCMALIIYIAVQPPNDKVLWITLSSWCSRRSLGSCSRTSASRVRPWAR